MIVTALRVFLSQLLCLGNCFFNRSNHVEGLFGQIIIFTCKWAKQSVKRKARNKYLHHTVMRQTTKNVIQTSSGYLSGYPEIPWWSLWGAQVSPDVQWTPQQPGKAEKGNAGSYEHEPQSTCLPQTAHPCPGWQWYPAETCSPEDKQILLLVYFMSRK